MNISKLILLCQTRTQTTSIGPGPTELMSGDASAGYFGVLNSSDFISGSQLATKVGLLSGTVINDTTQWLKFSYKNVLLYIPLMPIRSSVSWANLYSAGLVYGTDDNGTFQINSPNNQQKIIEINGNYFKVRLMIGAAIDPVNSSISNTYDSSLAIGSEWNNLMYRVNAFVPSNQNGGNWANYTDAQMGNTLYTVMKEHITGSASILVRGVNRIDYMNSIDASTTNSQYTWRPVLEYLGTRMPARKPISVFYTTDDTLKQIGGITAANSNFLIHPSNAQATIGDIAGRPTAIHYQSDAMIQAGNSTATFTNFFQNVGGITMTPNFVFKAISAHYLSDAMIPTGNNKASPISDLIQVSGIKYTVTDV